MIAYAIIQPCVFLRAPVFAFPTILVGRQNRSWPYPAHNQPYWESCFPDRGKASFWVEITQKEDKMLNDRQIASLAKYAYNTSQALMIAALVAGFMEKASLAVLIKTSAASIAFLVGGLVLESEGKEVKDD